MRALPDKVAEMEIQGIKDQPSKSEREQTKSKSKGRKPDLQLYVPRHRANKTQDEGGGQNETTPEAPQGGKDRRKSEERAKSGGRGEGAGNSKRGRGRSGRGSRSQASRPKEPPTKSTPRESDGFELADNGLEWDSQVDIDSSRHDDADHFDLDAELGIGDHFVPSQLQRPVPHSEPGRRKDHSPDDGSFRRGHFTGMVITNSRFEQKSGQQSAASKEEDSPERNADKKGRNRSQRSGDRGQRRERNRSGPKKESSPPSRKPSRSSAEPGLDDSRENAAKRSPKADSAQRQPSVDSSKDKKNSQNLHLAQNVHPGGLIHLPAGAMSMASPSGDHRQGSSQPMAVPGRRGRGRGRGSHRTLYDPNNPTKHTSQPLHFHDPYEPQSSPDTPFSPHDASYGYPMMGGPHMGPLYSPLTGDQYQEYTVTGSPHGEGYKHPYHQEGVHLLDDTYTRDPYYHR